MAAKGAFRSGAQTADIFGGREIVTCCYT